MNRIVSFRSALFLLLALGLLTPGEAKLLKPSQNGEEKEILIVNGKRRLYYLIRPEGLTYEVRGPVRLEFITRYPVVSPKKKRQAFAYSIVLDTTDTIQVHHRYKVQKAIRSVQHPDHFYTYSGNYFINLPAGNHRVQVAIKDEQAYPVLIRLLAKEFPKKRSSKRTLQPLIYQTAVTLKIGEDEVAYFPANKTLPLQVTTRDKRTLHIISRLAFEEWMGSEETYRLRVRAGKKVVGTYFFSTERSTEATIVEQPDRVPGKWRTCDIPVTGKETIFTVEVLDQDRTVLLRFLEYK